MIGTLHGTVESISGTLVVLQVGGVGYEVHCSRGAVEQLQVGAQTKLIVYTHVREDVLALFGFADRLEKQVFILLTQVQGVGVKSAAGIISQVDKVELLRIIGAGDLNRLKGIRGVGKKIAERMVVELKDRVADFAVETSAGSSGEVLRSGPPQPLNDAIEALQVLGFARKDAERAVAKVREAGGSVTEVGEIVKVALKYV